MAEPANPEKVVPKDAAPKRQSRLVADLATIVLLVVVFLAVHNYKIDECKNRSECELRSIKRIFKNILTVVVAVLILAKGLSMANVDISFLLLTSTTLIATIAMCSHRIVDDFVRGVTLRMTHDWSAGTPLQVQVKSCDECPTQNMKIKLVKLGPFGLDGKTATGTRVSVRYSDLLAVFSAA